MLMDTIITQDRGLFESLFGRQEKASIVCYTDCMKNHYKVLYQEAYAVSKVRKLSRLASCGGVGSALLTKEGNIYTGLCIDATCGIGFCAEHSAIAEMLKHNESEIKEIIAVTDKKKVLPPCGRCRELIFDINPKNQNALVHLSATRSKSIKILLPDPWGVG